MPRRFRIRAIPERRIALIRSAQALHHRQKSQTRIRITEPDHTEVFLASRRYLHNVTKSPHDFLRLAAEGIPLSNKPAG